MFKYTAAIFLLALVSLSAQAQMADRLQERPSTDMALSQDRDAVALTREMANRLHLNEAQVLKLLPLNRTKLTGLSHINYDYQDNETTRAAKTAELEAQFEQECRRILTPSQLSLFQGQQPTEQPAAVPAGTGNGLG